MLTSNKPLNHLPQLQLQDILISVEPRPLKEIAKAATSKQMEGLMLAAIRVKEERKQRLMEIQKEISLEKNSSFVGKKLKVLVEAVEGDFYIGRSYRDAPEVDGEVLIPKKNCILQTAKNPL